MRRDRLLVAIALVSLLAADIHFILLPRFRSWYHLPRDSCSCTNSSLESVPWTTSQNTTAVPSKLERLFNIRVPELGPEERLLEEDELVKYCKRKVSRWERYSTVFNKVFITSLNQRWRVTPVFNTHWRRGVSCYDATCCLLIHLDIFCIKTS